MREAYEALGRSGANHVALSPLSFLSRAEVVLSSGSLLVG